MRAVWRARQQWGNSKRLALSGTIDRLQEALGLDKKYFLIPVVAKEVFFLGKGPFLTFQKVNMWFQYLLCFSQSEPFLKMAFWPFLNIPKMEICQ